MKALLTCALGSFLALACGPADPAKTSGAAGTPSTGGSNGAGSSSGGASAGGGGGGNAQGGSSAGSNPNGGSSSGGSPSGGSSGGSNDTTPKGATGTVQFGRLLAVPGSSPSAPFEASARFYAKDANTGYDCSRETFGDCHISTCTQNSGTKTPSPYAGTITLSDGDKIDVTLMGTKGQDYSLPTGESASVSGGETITVNATGDEVPAFMATVAVPKVITVSAPSLDATGSVSASRSADLALTYDNRAADGETGTTLFVQSIGSSMITLDCQFPTTSGTASIPSAALSKLDAGTTLLLLTARIKQVEAGDFSVSVIAYISATNQDKSKAATIKLQ